MTRDIIGDKPRPGPAVNQTAASTSYPRRWSLAEIQSLRDMARAQIPKHEIATRLGRSTNSLEVQARKIGIKFVRIKKAHWLATKPC
jgi:hypothetical protein